MTVVPQEDGCEDYKPMLAGDEKKASNKIHLDRLDDWSSDASTMIIGTPGVGGGQNIIDLVGGEPAILQHLAVGTRGRMTVCTAPVRRPIAKILSAETLAKMPVRTGEAQLGMDLLARFTAHDHIHYVCGLVLTDARAAHAFAERMARKAQAALGTAME